MRAKELINIGLSEKESAVYLALLELGSDTVQNIAKKANVNRATTYVILDSLSKKGIVSTVEKEKKTFYQAESPEELMRLIRIQEAEVKSSERALQKLLPELKGMYNLAENKPVVRFYEGKEGVKSMADEFLRTSDKEIAMIYSRDHVEKTFSGDESNAMRDQRLKKGKSVKSIYTYKKGKLDATKGSERLRIPESQFPISSDIAISGDKVRVASLGDIVSGIIIEDREIAKTLRSVFLLAWEAAKKYD
jgi:HTH-type transcriptional regulator, sugar sensing transcriptional regulator